MNVIYAAKDINDVLRTIDLTKCSTRREILFTTNNNTTNIPQDRFNLRTTVQSPTEAVEKLRAAGFETKPVNFMPDV